LAMGRAIVNNIFHLRRTSGASTITMQVARMLEPKPRTYMGKCIEMFRAMQLELHYSKDEILQLYLNLVPYGSNIQGVKAAALLYFGKSPDQLSLAEITALSIIPNRPNSLVMGKDNARIVNERNKWLVRFKNDKVFPDNVIKDALTEPLTAYRHSVPKGLPQFAWRMRRTHATDPVIHSTVDIQMQQSAEHIIANYLHEMKLHNINNASVLVTDNVTHQVLVYVGSGDFDDRSHFGQVDGVHALRSPGSTLKPLLYGMAFDAGLVTPKLITPDVPINIRGYTPENYDKLFRGNVTIEYALRNSLNIPAVRLLDQLGTDTFIHRMMKAGFGAVGDKKKKPGLAVILGGCGVRLDELTAMYSSFANDGNYQPLAYTMPAAVKKTTADTTTKFTVLSSSSAYMLTQVLSELHRPDLPNAYDIAQGIPKIAWKTGTSYGRKDAWSIGYNKRYTIGVWLGNFSGQGVPELSGANTATPLLFQLFNALDHNAAHDWLEPPAALSFRLVCAETGMVP
ncbi:MAG: penicillin-binding protein 1C, partial [Chitinophagia bacterium]|nr:penicillin-binding protein 1C [Chitinophagia bacterium]